MEMPEVHLDRSTAMPLFRQLEAALAGYIAGGGLRPGDRLPSERELAAQLGVSRTTTVNAYRELEARGLIRGRVGQGTYVCASGHHAAAPFAWQGKLTAGAQRTVDPTLGTLVRGQTGETISFAAGGPALDRFPHADFQAALTRVLTGMFETAVGSGPPEGQPRLRHELARRTGARPDQVLVLNGSQQGLDLIARSLLEPGDTVVMDRPGYLGAIQTFRAAGARIVGWDARRADTDELESLLQRYRSKFLYTNPTFQNPTGRTLSPAARREVLRLASRYRLAVVEDEPYRELGFRGAPPASLFALDHDGLVIQLGTLSKSLAMGLRLGWLVAPTAIIEQLTLLRQRADLFGAGTFQLVAAELLANGSYDAHLQRIRREHERRYAAMTAALGASVPAGVLTWPPVTGGLYLWVTTSDGIDTTLLAQHAMVAGVAIVGGEHFHADGAGRHQFRLCFARCAPAAITAGVRRLSEVVRHNPGIRPRPSDTQPLV